MPIDPPDTPEIEISVPLEGSTLTGPRVGQSEAVEVSTSAFRTVFSATASISQPGFPRESFPLSHAGPDRWVGGVRARHPGAATLEAVVTGLIGASPTTRTLRQAIAVTIADTGPVTVIVVDPPGGPDRIVPPGGGPAGFASRTTAAVIERLECSFDEWATKATAVAARGGTADDWTVTLQLPNAAPASYTLRVRAYDYFGQVTTAQSPFRTIDNTPPVVVINAPEEDAVVLAATTPYAMTAAGTAADPQSGLALLEYTIDNELTFHTIPVAANGSWTIDIPIPSYGMYALRLRGTDRSGNRRTYDDRQFELAAAYTPRTMDELLSPRSYLQGLLKFVRAHVAHSADGSQMSTDTLRQALFQPFGELAQPTTTIGDRALNSLHVPLRVAQAYLQSAGWPSPVVAEWNFDDQTSTRIVDGGPYANHGTLGAGARWGTGPTAGALDLTPTGGAVIPHTESLALGDHDRDFSVSLWLYLRAGHNGQWRAILLKGHQTADFLRTPGLWMHPATDRLWFRISTRSNPDEGGYAVASISLDRWTHVAYVKAGRSLKLYLDGVLDSVVTLADETVANSDPLFLGQNPYFPGIDGALDDIRMYAFALGRDDVRRLAVERNRVARRTSPVDVTRAYLQSAYEAVLGGVGTSFTELRLLATLSAEQRTALAERLGVRAGAADHLGDLLPPTAGLSEAWLEDLFGIPGISRDPFLPPAYPQPLVLAWQQQTLRAAWSAEDADPVAEPYLDPDVIDALDLTSADREHPLAVRLATRRQWLADQRASIRAAGTGGTLDQAIHLVLGAADLDALAQRDAAGQSIAAELAALLLPLPAFRRLVALRTLAAVSSLSDGEWDDAADILAAVRKRQHFPGWRAEEAGLAIWPDGLCLSYHAHPAVAWRATYADRAAWQARVARRLAQWDGLARALSAAVAAAEQQALPVLRDGVLHGRFGDEVAPAIVDLFAERLLVDLGSAGATRATRIDQAVTSLQSLVNGLRTNRFGAGHPAAAWSLPERAANETQFEEEWTWMGSYGSWRAAVSIFLHPENALQPELRANASDAFKTLVADLRKARLTADGARKLLADAHLQGDEGSYFGPLLVGLELQKTGAFGAALGWYRQLYDASRLPRDRKLAPLLRHEENTAPVAVMDDHWTRLLDPHANAQTGRWGNPYTRFTLGTIIQCTLAYADSEYAAGTLDSLAGALGLYLSAKELLADPELDILRPSSSTQIFIPNPWFDALATHVTSALSKLRRGLSFAGLPLPADPTRPQDGAPPPVGISVRRTPYRFKVLLERAKQLATRAEQFEAQYLAALEKRDLEHEKLQQAGAVLEVGMATVELQQRRYQEAVAGTRVALAQRERGSIAKDQYDSWIAAGVTQMEQAQIDAMSNARTWRDVVSWIDFNSTANSAAMQAAGSAAWWLWYGAGAATLLADARATSQTIVNRFETDAQLNGIYAAQERRRSEWVLQRELARQDEEIGYQQCLLANAHVDVAAQELSIAQIQASNALAMVEFLTNKFTGAELYGWLAGVLAGIYAHFLRLAASTAKLAEDQLAFERQDPPARLIRADYWKQLPEQGNGDPQAPDRRGLSGSARLQQDLASLDQLAFESDRRLLDLSQTFSLARIAPFELQQFKHTGVLAFMTPSSAFDEGFPGHYLRRIKRVRVSVAALIPPNVGIRATLTASGISRVVTGPPEFSTVIVRQDPESVSLTSPIGATGVFDLDEQPELLLPFEGMGVDTAWTLELPPAANPFDFDSIADVIVTIDYTARSSPELRDRVTKRLPPQRSGDLAWSVRRDLPDAWYDLNNPPDPAAPRRIPLPISRRSFPPQLRDLSISQLAIALQPAQPDQRALAAVVTPSFVGDGGQAISAAGVPVANNAISTRGAAAIAWRDLLGATTASGRWTFTLDNDPAAPDNRILERLAAGELDDILVVLTFSGTRPSW